MDTVAPKNQPSRLRKYLIRSLSWVALVLCMVKADSFVCGYIGQPPMTYSFLYELSLVLLLVSSVYLVFQVVVLIRGRKRNRYVLPALCVFLYSAPLPVPADASYGLGLRQWVANHADVQAIVGWQRSQPPAREMDEPISQDKLPDSAKQLCSALEWPEDGRTEKFKVTKLRDSNAIMFSREYQGRFCAYGFVAGTLKHTWRVKGSRFDMRDDFCVWVAIPGRE